MYVYDVGERERVARAPVPEWERQTKAGEEQAGRPGREISSLANRAHGSHCIDVKWNRSSVGCNESL
jgi:hypothetical protein